MKCILVELNSKQTYKTQKIFARAFTKNMYKCDRSRNLCLARAPKKKTIIIREQVV